MKLTGRSRIAVKLMSIATLSCGVVLWTVIVGAGKHGSSNKTGSNPVATNWATKPGAAEGNRRWAEAYGRLPMSFEENQGQTAQEVRYVAHGGRYELFLTPQEAVIALRPTKRLDFSPKHRSAYLRALREQRRAAQTRTTTAIRMRLEGANPEPQISGADRLPTRVNYFKGSDPKNWHTDVPAYARVMYAGIYPGVDLVFYGNQRRLEYDFVVAPGADPHAIQLKIDGARKMRINSRGDLVLSVAEGEVELQKPLIFQQLKGEKREIAGNYVIAADHRVSFAVASYDRSEPLILDPVLDYSTYLGGGGAENTSLPVGIAVDSAGDAFIVGDTFSADFPTTANGLTQQPLTGNLGASFVAELNPSGTQLLYSTYLAGTTTNAGDGATSVAVDSTGKVYVAGVTFAAGFPTTTNHLPYSADTTNGTCFVTKLDPTQSGNASLVFSTYLGGTVGTGSFANGIAVDGNGNAYVVGETSATDFPTNGTNAAYQPAFNPLNVGNAFGSAFLSKISTSGTPALVYSTYLSGNAGNAATLNSLGYGDQAYGVAVDASNNAYVVGATTSNNSTGFPSSTNANEPAPPAANVLGSAFVTKINTAAATGAASFVYSTYVAGSTQEIGYGIALGPNNVAYVTGLTNSNDFPVTTGAFDTSTVGAGKAFVVLVDTTNTVVGNPLTPFSYATFLGGGNGDTGYGIKVDSTGTAYVVGTTASPNFPGTNTSPKLGGFQTTLSNPNGSAFIAKLSPGSNGTADLLYSTYFGGSGNGSAPDQGYAIAIDAASPTPNAYITGQTSSANLPVAGTPAPLQSNLSGSSDAYVAKFPLIPTVVVTPSPFDFGPQPVGVTSTPQIFTLTNNTTVTVTFTSIATAGVSPAANMDFAVTSDTCSPSGVAAGSQCTVTVTFKPGAAGLRTGTLTFTDSDTSSPQAINLSGTGSATAPGVGLAPTSLTFSGQLLTTTSAAQTVTLTNTGAGALTINSIAASGDFAETSAGATACPVSPATLAAGGTCTISVTFAPTAAGARTGTLTITDNAGSGTQTVPLMGTGWDFTLTAPATVTVKRGKTGSFNVTITPLGGFNQAVTVACAGAVMPVTCTPTSPVTPTDGVTPVTSTVTISAKGMTPPPPRMRMPPMSIRQIVPMLLALFLLFCLFMTRGLRTRLGVVTAMIVLLGFTGCNDGSKVKKGTSNLTITASSGGVSKTATVALTIN